MDLIYELKTTKLMDGKAVKIAASRQLFSYWPELSSRFQKIYILQEDKANQTSITPKNVIGPIHDMKDNFVNVNKNKINFIIGDDGFSKGTVFLNKPPNFEEVNPEQYLVNCLEIEFDANRKSFRYGTPINRDYGMQTSLIKNYIGTKKAVIISLLDICNFFGCRALKDKMEENKIISTELASYAESENIVFLPISCNNNVNIPSASSTYKSDREKSKIIKNKILLLGNWINDNKIPENLKGFYDLFSKSIIENEIPADLEFDKRIINAYGQEVNVSKEDCRLMMFCYLFVVLYLLFQDLSSEYVLLYHCKSGQDRTGIVFAINQMINEIMKKYYVKTRNSNKKIDFKEDLQEMNFQDFYKKYFDTTTSVIKDEIYMLYAKYLSFSYVITMTSTGFPGLKISLKKNTANNFPYLMLKDPREASSFEGASECRKS